jgi:hypothetical protein
MGGFSHSPLEQWPQGDFLVLPWGQWRQRCFWSPPWEKGGLGGISVLYSPKNLLRHGIELQQNLPVGEAQNS